MTESHWYTCQTLSGKACMLVTLNFASFAPIMNIFIFSHRAAIGLTMTMAMAMECVCVWKTGFMGENYENDN